jgi:hypothetical protein
MWWATFLYTTFALLDAPLHPVKGTGNVIPWSNHGAIHHVTSFEDHADHIVFFTAPIIIVLAFIGLWLYRGWDMFDRDET